MHKVLSFIFLLREIKIALSKVCFFEGNLKLKNIHLCFNSLDNQTSKSLYHLLLQVHTLLILKPKLFSWNPDPLLQYPRGMEMKIPSPFLLAKII